MTGDKWQRAQQLFLQVANRPSNERATLLEEACGNDAELRAEVESLLEHDNQITDDFLRPPEPPHAVPTDVPDSLVGERVGKYAVKSVIAAGGMGTVYEAVQDDPRRIVALKVMKRNIASRSAIRRFQFEAQVLGRLRHPNVAQVHEAGMHESDQGRVPYFAMEYIPDAKNIIDYASENDLVTRERLRLFAKVCDAVHHGHQKGVIHRDLKPGNLLVDSDGEPKVIDFGVARATDSDVAVTTMRTDVGQLIGTLQYMSPEQCDADPHDLDTRTDVYSLGVVLYELLCGQLPYDATGSSIFHAAQIIKEHEPVRLSSINPKLCGDVETIVLKALEKDRERRYQSADELARDIRRYLNHEPIEARPATAWTRVIHWVASHPVGTTAVVSTSLAVLIIAATCVSLWFVNSRPYEIVLLKRPGLEGELQGYEARLLSLSGRSLQRWPSDDDAGISLAELVDGPPELDGGPLAVLGFQDGHTGPLGGAICVFDVTRDLEQPLWERRVNTDEILPDLLEWRSLVGERFGAQCAWVFDVFPSRVGLEIVVAFNAGEHSQRVLRIYDLNGERLYEVWHDGAIAQCFWMSEAGLLVCSGDSQKMNWERDKRRNAKPDPYVVFALRPKVGFIGTNWLPSQPGNDPLSPVWYLRLRPEDAPDIVKGAPQLKNPGPLHDPGSSVQCLLHLAGKTPAGVWWVLDESGREISGTRDSENEYKRNRQLPDDDLTKLPDPNIFELVQVEKVVSSTDVEGEPLNPDSGEP